MDELLLRVPNRIHVQSLCIVTPSKHVYEIVNSNIPELKQGGRLTVLQGSIWIPIFFTKGNLF